MNGTDKFLWIVIFILATISTMVSLISLSSNKPQNVSVLMPMYTYEALTPDTDLHRFGIPIPKTKTPVSSENRGWHIADGLAATTYLGPSLSPEDVSRGLLLLNKEPGLQPTPNQLKQIKAYGEAVQKDLGNIHDISLEIARLTKSLHCATAELISGLPPEVADGMKQNQSCQDSPQMFEETVDKIERAGK